MGPFDNLIASSATRHRVKLLTSAGLEKLLVQELSTISSDCSLLSGGHCYVEASVDLFNLWKIVLESRVCENLWMHVCEPFPARHVRSFMRALNQADWRGFIPFSAGLPMPYVRVTCKDSALYHTGMIRTMVHEVIKGHCHKSVQVQGDELPSVLQRRGCTPICPSLMVNIDGDMCEVLANTSGDLSERPWSAASSVDARIRPSMVAGLALQLELVHRINEGCISTIWDPMCHDGSLLLELYSLLRGHRLRPLDHVYPLTNFPLNSRDAHDSASDSFDSTALLHRNVRLLGTDMFAGCAESAASTFGKYRDPAMSRPPIARHGANQKVAHSANDSDGSTGECSSSSITPGKVTLAFSPAGLSDVPVDVPGTMILTNLYYGNKGRRKEFVDSHRIFESFLFGAPHDLLREVYVVATDNFRKNSRFTWECDFRFNNDGVKVMLLKLCGVKN